MLLLLLGFGERRRRFDGDVSASGVGTEIGRENVVPIREIEAEGVTAGAASPSRGGGGGGGRRDGGGGAGVERRIGGEAAHGRE